MEFAHNHFRREPKVCIANMLFNDYQYQPFMSPLASLRDIPDTMCPCNAVTAVDNS